MKRIALALLLSVLALPAIAADNLAVTPGSGATIRMRDTTGAGGPLSSYVILGDLAGASIYGIAGTANANIISVQGIASMTPLLINPGTAASWGINTLGSTTSGQSGQLALGAVTTAAPTYTTAQSNALSLDTAGNLRVNVVTGGAGGGAVTVADGADVAEGAKADAACSTDIATCSVIALLKRNNQNVAAGSGAFGSPPPASGIAIGGSDGTNLHTFGLSQFGAAPAAGQWAALTTNSAPVVSSFVDGWDVTQGAKADAVCGTATGTCSQIALSKFIANAVSGPIPTQGSTVPVGGVGLLAGASGGCTGQVILTAASNNATQIKASAGTLCSLRWENTTTSVFSIRFYDTATAPAAGAPCNSATGVVVNDVAQSNAISPGGVANLGPYGQAFAAGIVVCVTGANANNDNTNAVTGLNLNLSFK